MTTAFRHDDEVLQRCLREGWISAVQAEVARTDIAQRRAKGDMTPMPTVLYGLGFLDPFRALALLQDTPLAAIPAQIGPYRIGERLGAGGMGEVYRAQAPNDATVAIKLIPSSLQANRETDKRFRREIRVGRRFRHAHVVEMLDAGKDGAQRWLAMEFVPGPNLRQRIASGSRLSEAEAIVLLAQLALALRTAWHHRVLHRDIKPSNIMLAPPRAGCSEPFCAKLCDFGLAKAWRAAEEDVEGSSLMSLTALGLAVGTPHYMSPEQATGTVDLDQRCDIYGLAATLFHGLTGTTVHMASSSHSVLTQQVTGTIHFNLLDTCGISSAFCALLRNMLVKDRAQRLRDWDWLLTELRVIAPTVVATVEANVRIPNANAPTLESASGLSLWWLVSVAAFMAIIGGIGWLLID